MGAARREQRDGIGAQGQEGAVSLKKGLEPTILGARAGAQCHSWADAPQHCQQCSLFSSKEKLWAAPGMQGAGTLLQLHSPEGELLDKGVFSSFPHASCSLRVQFSLKLGV